MRDDIVARRTNLETGCWVEIVREGSLENPLRDWEWAGHLILIPRYAWAGTDEGNDDPSESEFWKRIRAIRIFGGVSLPVYAYDHSGISFSVSSCYPFCDQWDGGQAGYAYMTSREIHSEYNGDKARAIEHLKAMVRYADAYSNNECYGYQLYDSDGNELDSCWGFWNICETWKDFMDTVAESVPDDFANMVRDCCCGSLDPIEVIPARYFVPGFAPAL